MAQLSTTRKDDTMIRKRIEVVLDAEEMEFVKWMAKRDNVTIQQELWMFFNTEFEQCKNLYMDEMKAEKEGD